MSDRGSNHDAASGTPGPAAAPRGAENALATGALSPVEREEARRYGRAQLALGLADRAVDGVYLTLSAFLLARPIDAWLAQRVAGDYLRLMLLFLVVMLLHECCSFPLSFFAGYVLEHRYALSRQSLAGWAWRHVKQFGLAVGFSLVMILGLFAVIRWVGDAWWLVAAGLFFVVSIVLGQLLPVVILPLFYKIERLNQPELSERLSRLAADTGLSLEGVYRLDLSAETAKANAMLAGLGRTRRVLLGDTLLASFSPEEIDIIFAHELGHHVYRHIRKLIVAGLLFSAAGFLATHFFLLGWLGIESFGRTPIPVYAVPAILWALWLFSTLLEPLQNAISRRYERQCDRYALARTGNATAYQSAFHKLSRLNKDDPDPHWLEVLLLHSHPPISERLAIAGERANQAWPP